MYDVVIIGGGPAGASAALILGRCRRRVLVVDAGEPRNAAAQAVHGFLGHDGIAPTVLRQLGQHQALHYRIDWRSDRVVDAHPRNESSGYPTAFQLAVQSGQQFRARKLLFATGMKDELPDFPGVKECYGVSVHHCPYCDGYEHGGQRIVVYGSTLARAVGLAINVRTWSDRVTVLTNGQRLTAEHEQRLSASGIHARVEPLVRLVNASRQLTGIELEGYGICPCDVLFFNTTQQPQCDLPARLGVTCPRDEEEDGPTNRKQRTNIPGVFIAGDADGTVQFAIVAAAEGATAATAIHRDLLQEDEARRLEVYRN